MSQRAARKYPEEVPERPELSEAPAEDPQALRKRALARVLSHRGQIELDLDQETLARLRSASTTSRSSTGSLSRRPISTKLQRWDSH